MAGRQPIELPGTEVLGYRERGEPPSRNTSGRQLTGDSADDIARDIAAISRIDAVPSLLQVLCDTTGMGFAAVARVTDGTWTACAVKDNVAFGLKPGGQLPIETTLCTEVRASRTPIVIDQASTDPRYAAHHTPRIYGIESYVSVPIMLSNGDYFGNLCAIDARPAKVSEPRIVSMLTLFAQLVALHLENDRRRETAEAALLDERAVGELREQFIAILGHDLRNPLGAVSACGQLLEKKSSDPALSAAARLMTNVRRMSALIDDVPDFARARLGAGIDVHMHDVADLDEALLAVESELQDSIPGRLIACNVAIGRTIRCDRARMQQLASNLLSNALTHGAPSRPSNLPLASRVASSCSTWPTRAYPSRRTACRRSSSRSGAIRRRRPRRPRTGASHLCADRARARGNPRSPIEG